MKIEIFYTGNGYEAFENVEYVYVEPKESKVYKIKGEEMEIEFFIYKRSVD